MLLEELYLLTIPITQQKKTQTKQNNQKPLQLKMKNLSDNTERQ